MSENHHYDRAKSRLHNGTNNEVTRAQVEATLALAHEQRTANLIALYTADGPLPDLNYGYLRKEIDERLGIK